VGLGTGGIPHDRAPQVFSEALRLGYRLFDLAREYGNEPVAAQMLAGPGAAADRSKVFLQSKVWPTQLGFAPTTRALAASLRELRTTYIDQYMLHWPRQAPEFFCLLVALVCMNASAVKRRHAGLTCPSVPVLAGTFHSCDPEVEWLRCWDTEDPAGTWRESYRALERAYAEGRVLSIGVSNFDAALLEELHTQGTVRT
jgi:diketogulonate reductase-like aldo/keto reductase